MFTFDDNKKTVNEIVSLFTNGKLIVDDTYQRRSVWNEKDKIRLVETILLGLVIPELFFWNAETDPDTGASITHIVDGQQRIKAICSFINNEFKLNPQYLLDDEIKKNYANKFFKDFTSEDKKSFWNYRLMIIDIDPKATRHDIITMFNRLNLTNYSLNDQEKRNSLSGDFAALARELSESDLWDNYRLFTGADIRRMKDVEFCASLILLYRKGIIDQTDQSALNQAYEELQEGYTDAENDKNAILMAINTIQQFFINDDVTKFLRRKAQLYTLFSVIFYMQREMIEIQEIHKSALVSFVQLYSEFNNDLDLTDQLSEQEKTLYDMLKKYKLASSEGLNKHTNRSIRHNVMRDFLFSLSDEQAAAKGSLLQKMQDSNRGHAMQEDPGE